MNFFRAFDYCEDARLILQDWHEIFGSQSLTQEQLARDREEIKYCSEHALPNAIAPWSQWHNLTASSSILAGEWPGLGSNDGIIEKDIAICKREPLQLYEYENDTTKHCLKAKSPEVWHLETTPKFTYSEVKACIPARGISMDDLLAQFEQINKDEQVKTLKMILTESAWYDAHTDKWFPLSTR